MAAGESRGSESGFTRRRLLVVAGSAGASVVVARTLWRASDKTAVATDTPPSATDTAAATDGAAPSVPGDAPGNTPEHAPEHAPGEAPGDADAGTEPDSSGLARWSDPATWGGRVPGARDLVTVLGAVELDIDARAAGVTIPLGSKLVFQSTGSRTLETTGNVVVEGELEMSPASPNVVHRVVFAGINEARFVGGGMAVLASDVGLWVVGEGVLNATGSPKLAWARAAGGIAQGASQVRLDMDPTGWRVGDEIVMAPTLAPNVASHWAAYDTASIAAIDGRVVTLSAPTAFDHPTVTVANGSLRAPEILNLSRNVAIEGTPTGRSHIFLLSANAQTLRHALVRHMGPRKGSGEDDLVVGRYGIHFHMAEDGSRGSVMEGVVGRDCGSHTFVTHLSHGVTWRDCITHDTLEEAYWWDPKDTHAGIRAAESNDVLYERCVASRITVESKRFQLAGFFLGAGSGNIVRGCTVFGIESSGMIWPSSSQGVWTSQDNVSHNNRRDGILVWQNTDRAHVIERFTCYHNGGYGVSHGAYKNGYHYDGGILYGNGLGSLSIKALSFANPSLRFSGVACDAAGLSDYNVAVPNHIVHADRPVLLVGCSFRGHRVAALGFVGEGQHAHRFDLVANSYEGNEFWLASGIPGDSVVRVQDPMHGSVELLRVDMPGSVNPRWNASVRPVPPFA